MIHAYFEGHEYFKTCVHVFVVDTLFMKKVPIRKSRIDTPSNQLC